MSRAGTSPPPDVPHTSVTFTLTQIHSGLACFLSVIAYSHRLNHDRAIPVTVLSKEVLPSHAPRLSRDQLASWDGRARLVEGIAKVHGLLCCTFLVSTSANLVARAFQANPNVIRMTSRGYIHKSYNIRLIYTPRNSNSDYDILLC